MSWPRCLHSKKLHYLCLSSFNHFKNLSSAASVTSRRKFSARLTFITFTTFHRLAKFFYTCNFNTETTQQRPATVLQL